jgi:hypothetical protein
VGRSGRDDGADVEVTSYGVSMPSRTYLSTGPSTPFYQGVYSDREAELMTRYAGSLYVARCEMYRKVGFTTKGAAHRVRQLSWSTPFAVELLREWDGTRWDEWCWHQRLWKWRVRGEWYELPEEIEMELMTG